MDVISIGEERLKFILNEISKMYKINIGKIVDMDLASNTVSVEMYYKKGKEGDEEWFKLPVLTDVPLVVMQGGKSFIKPPIRKGDECVVLFNDRDIDNWFDNSSEIPNTPRMHSLSDGFALIGITSLKRVLEYKEDVFQLVVDKEDIFEFIVRGEKRDDPLPLKLNITKEGFNFIFKGAEGDKALLITKLTKEGYNLNFKDKLVDLSISEKEGIVVKDKKGTIAMKEGRYSIINHAGDDFIKVLEDVIIQLQTTLQEVSKMQYNKPVDETSVAKVTSLGTPAPITFVFAPLPVDNALKVGQEANNLTPLIKKIKEFKK